MNRIKNILQSGTIHDVVAETRWIYRHTRAYRKAVIAYTLLGLLVSLLGIVSSVITRELVDEIIAKQGMRVLHTGITVFSLGVISVCLGALVNRYGAKINLRVANELRAEVYSVFMSTEWLSLQQYHSGDLLSRINNDVATVSSSVLGWLPTLIIKSAQFLLSLAVIVWYDSSMAVIALLTAPLTLLVAKPFLRKMRNYSKEMRQVNSEMIAFCEETLQNAQSIKAFHLVEAFCKKLDEVQEKYYDRSMAYNRFSVRNSSFLSISGLFVSYLCIGWGAFRLWGGQIDYFGTMVLFIQLAGYLSASLTALIKLVPSVVECTVSAQRIMAVFSQPQEDTSDLEQAKKLLNQPCELKLEGLSFSYCPEQPVLTRINLSVKAGETIAIMGASGSGKTTLFRILLGLISPSEGTAYLSCANEQLPLSPSTRILFSYVPQDHVVFSGTVADTLRLVRPDATDETLYEALRIACAEDFVRALPQGLQTSLKERGGSLSLGQNQRLALARAVLSDAPILVLDEVTSALDLETEKQVLQNIASLPNKTCILSTHRPSVLPLCDHIYRIKDHQLHIQ